MTRNDTWTVLLRIGREINPITIRCILGVASLLWGIALVLGPQTFQRTGWIFLSVISTEWVWAIVFFINFAGILWRLLDPVSRPKWALLINCYGWGIWFFSTLATNIAVGAFTPSSAMEWSMLGFQTLVILRTGTKREVVTF